MTQDRRQRLKAASKLILVSETNLCFEDQVKVVEMKPSYAWLTL